MTGKERVKAVLEGRTPDQVPVFPLLMTFSARRIGATYRQFATNGTVMAEAQLHVRERFGLDAITACTDAFRITADLGAEMRFPEETPPYAVRPLVTCEEDLAQLKRPDPSDSRTRMYDRAKGVAEMVRHAGDQCMVLGWVDMPFAEICSICGVQNVMIMMYDEPELVHALLEFVTPIVCDFACFQLECGAEMVGCGDAAASLISPALYREFALPYEQRVNRAIHEKKAWSKLHICGNTTAMIEDVTECGADLVNIDHLVDPIKALACCQKKDLACKGFLDPVADVMQATPEEAYAKARKQLEQAKERRFMLSAGCEIPVDTPDEVFSAFCRAVRP